VADGAAAGILRQRGDREWPRAGADYYAC